MKYTIHYCQFLDGYKYRPTRGYKSFGILLNYIKGIPDGTVFRIRTRPYVKLSTECKSKTLKEILKVSTPYKSKSEYIYLSECNDLQ